MQHKLTKALEDLSLATLRYANSILKGELLA